MEKQIYEKALALWGYEAQLAMVIEECAELILAIEKAGRIKNPQTLQERTERIVEEAIDVSLMIEELKIMIPLPNLWEDIRSMKLQRLKKLLDAT